MAQNGLLCSDVPLGNYSLIHFLFHETSVSLEAALMSSFKVLFLD